MFATADDGQDDINVMNAMLALVVDNITVLRMKTVWMIADYDVLGE